jgi:PleD family two-component response regulator
MFLVLIKILLRALLKKIKTNRYDFSSVKGARALVVEDNRINQIVACGLLEEAGLICKVANNGQECLRIAEGEKFDVIFIGYTDASS